MHFDSDLWFCKKENCFIDRKATAYLSNGPQGPSLINKIKTKPDNYAHL